MAREITGAQRDWLGREVDAWCVAGLITDDQANAILARYVTPEEIEAGRQSKALLTLLALATVLVGLGVLLFVGYNWDAMHPAAKVAALLTATLGAHGAGLAVRERYGARRLSEVGFLFGSLLYGAGIWLIAQIFHVSAHHPDGLWWWAVGVLPFALLLETPVHHVLYVGLLAGWAGWEVLGFPDIGLWLFARLRWLPNGAYGLPILAAPGVLWAYRRRSPAVLGLYVPLLAWWAVLQLFVWGQSRNPTYLVGAIGGLLMLAAEVHPAGSPMAVPFRTWGVALAGGALVPASYSWFLDSVHSEIDPIQRLVPVAIVLAIAAGLLARDALAVRRAKPGEAADRLRELLGRTWLPAGLVVLMAALELAGTWRGSWLLPSILANAAMVALAIWMIRAGLREDRGSLFSAGVGYFLFWAVLRYVDLFGAFGGMLGGAAVFMVCGLTLFGVAMYWRRRKEVRLG